ncbi:hypothetical protein AX16_009816 [Volvariella volvacea WC 439]|nr:hypothetical protein AX16_009816 [Volvariella volvacea WC 439]
MKDPSCMERIANLDAKIRYHYSCIRELCETRNTLIPIHRLPTEVLCRVFKEVSTTNRAAQYGNVLIWHPNIVHVCRHWRSIGLAESLLWSYISLGDSVQDEALACYIQRASKSQNVRLISHSAQWESILTLLEVSDCHITSITAIGLYSQIEFWRICSRFRVLSSIQTLNVPTDPYHNAQLTILPVDCPFLSPTNQAQIQTLLLNPRFYIPWELRPQFTGLQHLCAGASITCRQECLDFLASLEYMTSLQELHIFQYPKKTVDRAAIWKVYEDVVEANRKFPVHPFKTKLENYGDIEVRLILTPLSLDNLQVLQLRGPFFLSENQILMGAQLLEGLIPMSFHNLVQHLDFRWSNLSRDFDLIGSPKKPSPLILQTPDDFVFDISGPGYTHDRPQPLAPWQHLRDVINLAQTLAPCASSLYLSSVDCTQLDNGAWPSLMILQSFPQIQDLIIDGYTAGTHFLPSSGLSCLQILPEGSGWQSRPTTWDWSQLQKETLAIGIVHRYSDPENQADFDEEMEVEGNRLYVSPKQVFEPPEREVLYNLVTSLVPRLQTLQLPQYELHNELSLSLMLNCIYFRKAISLPILKVVIPPHVIENGLSKLREAGVEVEFIRNN